MTNKVRASSYRPSAGWANQPLPDLERLALTTSFHKDQVIWTEQRLLRRARGQDLSVWLESIQTVIDADQYGEAIHDLQDLIRVFPESAEARSLLDEVHRQQTRSASPVGRSIN